jgi:hypothetical protein
VIVFMENVKGKLPFRIGLHKYDRGFEEKEHKRTGTAIP